MKTADPRYISLFSGAGGLDLGLEMAGWRTAYASDNDPYAVATLKANAGRLIAKGRKVFEGTYIEQADVRTLDAKSLLNKASLAKGDFELLAGGPPCQSWSSAGHQLGFADPRGRLFADFVRLANSLDARWLLLENVRGLLTARGPDKRPGSALELIRRDLLAAGFQTNVGLLNAADFGVPQRRVRLFILGFRQGDAPPFPFPNHAKKPTLERMPYWLPLQSALDTVGELRSDEIFKPTGKMAEDLAGLRPGSGVKSPGKAERTRPGGHWGYKQGAFVADAIQSARTVTASAQQDWVRDPIYGIRRLCPRECAAIQSFPNSWTFEGPLVSQYRLIGNAVPPILARCIGASLRSHIQIKSPVAGAYLEDLLPLPAQLAYHVNYTAREEASNGKSRQASPRRRTSAIRTGIEVRV